MKLKKNEVVKINIPFTYTIGDWGFQTDKELESIEDCLAEIRAEINNGILGEEIMAVVDDNIYYL